MLSDNRMTRRHLSPLKEQRYVFVIRWERVVERKNVLKYKNQSVINYFN